MWVILHNISDWVYSKTRTLNQPRENSVYLRKSNVRSRKKNVSETNFSVSHSSTESEVTSVDAGLRMDDMPARDLWDLVIEVLHSFFENLPIQRDPRRREAQKNHTNTNIKTKKHPNREDLELFNVDHVTTSPQTQNLLTLAHCFTFLKTLKQ